MRCCSTVSLNKCYFIFLYNTNSQHLIHITACFQGRPVFPSHSCSAGRLKSAKCLLLWTNSWILLPSCEAAVIRWLISSGLHTQARMLYFVLNLNCIVASTGASMSDGVEGNYSLEIRNLQSYPWVGLSLVCTSGHCCSTQFFQQTCLSSSGFQGNQIWIRSAHKISIRLRSKRWFYLQNQVSEAFSEDLSHYLTGKYSKWPHLCWSRPSSRILPRFAGVGFPF